jgi:putative hydrolase of the HAD superfamily
MTLSKIAWGDVDTFIFDMDGTLLDLHFDNQVWNHLLPSKLASKHNIDKMSATKIIENLLEQNKKSLNWYSLEYWSRTLDLSLVEIENELEYLITLRSGAKTLLEKLKQGGFNLTLATNASLKSMDKKLEITAIRKYFDHVCNAHEIGYCKEQIEFWTKLSSSTQCNFKTTILVDDNLDVLETAQLCGIKNTFGIARPNSHGEGKKSNQFYLIRDLDDISPTNHNDIEYANDKDSR